MYQRLLQRSGLSADAAAKLHRVPVGRVKLWTEFKIPVPHAALNALDLYCRTVKLVANDKRRA